MFAVLRSSTTIFDSRAIYFAVIRHPSTQYLDFISTSLNNKRVKFMLQQAEAANDDSCRDFVFDFNAMSWQNDSNAPKRIGA